MTSFSLIAASSALRMREGSPALNSLPSRPSQDLTAGAEAADYGAEHGSSNTIANLVQLNLTPEMALKRSIEIKNQLIAQALNIANDRPQDLFAVFDAAE
ncbi:MAG TPA: hypothetical protein VEA77_05875 [Hyphomicrobium sp.]|nr:hypothetical protein [Hyphomicrobium sp.]